MTEGFSEPKMKISERVHKDMKSWTKAAAICFWLLVWQGLSMLVDSNILLASPLTTLQALGRLAVTGEFWTAIGSSFLRIIGGFLLALFCGTVLAWFAYRSAWVRTLMEPPVRIIKATPVASFVIVVLLWVSSARLSVVIAFLIVFPVVYTNLLQGFLQTDGGLLEMSRIFRMRTGPKLRYIYLPAVRPYLLSAVSLGLGMCWKAGVAAEVIGLPAQSIGRNLYNAKLYLETPELFAWTVTIVAVSAGFEKLATWCLARLLSPERGRGRLSGSKRSVNPSGSRRFWTG